MEPPGKILWFSLKLTTKIEVLKTRNYLRHSKPQISENVPKKSIQLKLFSIYKNSIFNLCPNVA